MRTTLLTIDQRGFGKSCHGKSPEKIAEELETFYSDCQKIVLEFQWQIIKTMGDCLLISTECPMDEKVEKGIRDLKKRVEKKYRIEIRYRNSTVTAKKIQLGSYSCCDVFGEDVNLLFMEDPETKTI